MPKTKSQEDIQKEVSTYYVTENDRVIIENFTKGSTAYALSFRISGSATIKRLEKGAGAKPHDILEKSIKLPHDAYEKGRLLTDNEKKLNADYLNKLSTLAAASASKNETDILQQAFNMVTGFVGHWSAEGKLLGLYLTDKGAFKVLASDYKSSVGTIATSTEKERRYLCMSPDSKENLTPFDFKQLATFGTKWETFFFTGDYDLHDHIEFVGGSQPLIENTNDYNRFVTNITTALSESAQLGKSLKDDPDYKRIQHGAQFGYIAYMINEELEQSNGKPLTLPEGVAKWKFPIAFCSKDVWTLITTEDEYNEFYKKIGLTPKNSWASEKDFASAKARFNKTYLGKAKIV